MIAVVIKKYGSPEQVLELQEIATPTPKEKEVLVKIHATTINDYDWSFVRGRPFIYRLMFGFSKPKHLVPGMELSGVIEETGIGVHKFKVGDAVYGDISDHGFGTFATYICIHEDAVVKKPPSMSFEAAAAIPHASLLALQALRNIANIQNGQHILINGGGGGVGTMGLQIAKVFNCAITGVDTVDKLNMMQSVGFDFVVDYKKEDFTKNGVQYDVILDCKSHKSPFAYIRSLKPKGTYITVGGELPALLKILIWGKIFRFFSAKKFQILSLKPNRGLEYMNKLFEENKISPVIDGPYSMDQIPSLISYFGEGKHKGKIVIKMD